MMWMCTRPQCSTGGRLSQAPYDLRAQVPASPCRWEHSCCGCQYSHAGAPVILCRSGCSFTSLCQEHIEHSIKAQPGSSLCSLCSQALPHTAGRLSRPTRSLRGCCGLIEGGQLHYPTSSLGGARTAWVSGSARTSPKWAAWRRSCAGWLPYATAVMHRARLPA